MSFAEMLTSFTGRTIEVFFADNPPFTGILESADACMMTLQINNSYYYSQPVTISIMNDHIQFVRIMA